MTIVLTIIIGVRITEINDKLKARVVVLKSVTHGKR